MKKEEEEKKNGGGARARNYGQFGEERGSTKDGLGAKDDEEKDGLETVKKVGGFKMGKKYKVIHIFPFECQRVAAAAYPRPYFAACYLDK